MNAMRGTLSMAVSPSSSAWPPYTLQSWSTYLASCPSIRLDMPQFPPARTTVGLDAEPLASSTGYESTDMMTSITHLPTSRISGTLATLSMGVVGGLGPWWFAGCGERRGRHAVQHAASGATRSSVLHSLTPTNRCDPAGQHHTLPLRTPRTRLLYPSVLLTTERPAGSSLVSNGTDHHHTPVCHQTCDPREDDWPSCFHCPCHHRSPRPEQLCMTQTMDSEITRPVQS